MSDLPPADYQRGNVRLYRADCLELLPIFPPNFFDVIVTDPPYGIRYVTAWRSHTDKLRKAIANDDSMDIVKKAWPYCLKCLGKNRHWYAFCSPSMIFKAQEIFSPKQLLAWDKGDRGTVGDLECGFGEAWEAIAYGMK